MSAVHASDREQFDHALHWLDRLLAFRTAELRQRMQEAPGARTQYISHEEIDWLLTRAAAAPVASAQQHRELEQEDPYVRTRTLAELSERFGLSAFEECAVLVCVAPELDRKYDKLYAYLQDDVTRKRPSADFLLGLLCDDAERRWVCRQALTRQARLIKTGILEEVADPASPSGASDLARFLRLDARILGFLFGDSELDARLAGIAYLDERASTKGYVDATIEDRVACLVEGAPVVVHLSGADAGSRRHVARHACGRLLRVSVPALQQRGEPLLRLALRESVLSDAVLFFEDADSFLDPGHAEFATLMYEHPGVAFLASDETWGRPPVFRDLPYHEVDLPLPAPALRESAWRDYLAPHATPDVWAQELARRFRLTPDQIRNAVSSAFPQETEDVQFSALAHAARRQSRHRLGLLAVHVEPHATWGDLIVPEERIEQLREICEQVQFQYDVLDEWDFGSKVSLGRGVSVLFSGSPGTGKTLAAEVMANELELDLYKIDLSKVVSKWIGETEKNLDRIFHEAEASNAILLFDEADALFGKRTKVSDAHDRYANVETSYLLTRIEAHDGVVILATNLRENIDDAFNRRIRFVVEFPFPDEASRRRIWVTHFPDQAPLAPDLDFDYLARELKITGGSIRNIVLNAAYLAAADGRTVEMDHIVHASRRELEKIGKLWGGLDDLSPNVR